MSSGGVRFVLAGSVLALIVILALDRLLVVQPEVVVSLSGNLTKAQEKSIELLASLAQLVITVATGLLGLLTFYIKDQSGVGVFASRAQSGTLAAAACSALSSIYFGHRTISALAEMLANDYFVVTGHAVARAVVLQYVFLCIAVIATIWFVVIRSAGSGSPKAS